MHAYDHKNKFFFPMILNMGAIAVCPHYGLIGDAVEKSIKTYLPGMLGGDWEGKLLSLFTHSEELGLKSFEDLKMHLLVLGLLAERKRLEMREWHWDQWLLNYHIALQSDGNVGLGGPRPGTALPEGEVKKIQNKL